MKSESKARWYHFHPMTKLVLVSAIVLALIANIESETNSIVSWHTRTGGTVAIWKSAGVPFRVHQERQDFDLDGGANGSEDSWHWINLVWNGLFTLVILCALAALVEFVVESRIRFHQLHLSTALALLLATGALMSVNFRERRELRSATAAWQNFGWPYSAVTRQIRFARRAESGGDVLDLPLVGKPQRLDISLGLLCVDLAFAISILTLIAVILERKNRGAGPETR